MGTARYVNVYTREELDRAIKAGKKWIRIRRSGWFEVRDYDVHAYDYVAVYAYGKSRVVAHNWAKVLTYDFTEVEAFDNSKVWAHNNSQVTSYDHANVYTENSSKVEAFNNSDVVAYDDSMVSAYDESKVTAWGRTKVVAKDKVRVFARDCSTIHAYDEVSVLIRSPKVTVFIYSDKVKVEKEKGISGCTIKYVVPRHYIPLSVGR